jgi:uncharacterized protein YbjT (DUF2867 family)
MILITGGTGKIGQELVQDLRARNCEFKVMVRSKEAQRRLEGQGIEAVIGDFERPGTCAEALGGVRQVFLLTVPQPAAAGIEKEFLKTCKARGVQHVVRLSAIGANPWAASGLLRSHGRCEQQLEECGLSWTVLRPTMFMQNLGAFFSQGIARESTLYAPAGEARVAWVDTRDIAAVAGTVLSTSGHEGLIYEITGPQAWTFAEVAERLGNRLGRRIAFVDVPDGAARQAMTDMGLSPWLAEGMITLYQFFKCNGITAQVLGTVERLTGRPARTLDAYLLENLAAFRSAKATEVTR